MHECPDCGQACDCDGEDTWWNNYDQCEHWHDPECIGNPDYVDPDDDFDYEDNEPITGEVPSPEGYEDEGDPA
jgi:hypothetical protein